MPARRMSRFPARGASVELVDLAGKANGRELVVARVEGHRLEHVGAGAQELGVELSESIGVLERTSGVKGPACT
jgi:hypothetical protein